MKHFFKVPKKLHHGLLLVTNIAERYETDEPVSLERVADKEHLSQGFLEEIAAYLRSAGIIKGRRGAGGGYVLAKNPADITVAEVLTSIDGPIEVIDCLGGKQGCDLSRRCTNRNVWLKVQKQILETLGDMTIADVIGVSDYSTGPKKI